MASTGAIFDKQATKDDGTTEVVPHIKALWFRRKDDERAYLWGKNPAFEPYGGVGPDRIADDLPVESFLVEVTDNDLTEAGLANKWVEPKLKEAFTNGKLRWIAMQYGYMAEQDLKKRKRRA